MGIQGLLPALKSITVTTHVKHYAQQTLGVDAYVWLHRGAFACAWDLALGKHTTKYVDYAMHRVRMLKHYGVTPYIVFDGDFLPSKARTEVEREARRAESAKLGRECMSRGNTKLAQEYFQKAIDITPDMALRFIHALQKEGFDYVVAPYEADAQLAYLERIGLVDGIVTEDSDLLVFGCKKVLFKMNEFGECMEVSQDRFAHNSGLNLNGFDVHMFRYMAILSGCDYLASVPGMGLKNAHRLVRKHRQLEYILKGLKAEFGFKLPTDYEAKFRRANLTFMHQWVFCPLKQALVMGVEASAPLDEETCRLIGAHLPEDLARAVARGLVDPITKQPIILKEVAESSKRPSMKHSKSAPPLGNMLMDAFLAPRKPKAVLAELDMNVQSKADAELALKRTAPRPSLREQAQLKKMKLFESSPSPPSTKNPGRDCLPLAAVKEDKENIVSPFFAPRNPSTPLKVVRPDKALEAALAASMAEEEKRKEFEGFENPIAFEVDNSLCTTVPTEPLRETAVISNFFPGDRNRPDTALSDRTPKAAVNLPTPPNSQDLSHLVASWKQLYTLPMQSIIPKLPSKPSSSIARMGGHVLSRQSSVPNLSGSTQRRPFTAPSFSSSPNPPTPKP